MRAHRFSIVRSVVAGLSLGVGACGSSPVGPESDPQAGYFESSANGSQGRGVNLSGDSAAEGPSAAPGQGEAGGDPAREIAEADIIQLDGGTLYAMSRSGGLSVIDVRDPGALKILGRYRTSFTPFEMYLRDGVVFAMYTDWGQFVQQEGTEEWIWKQTSALLALDVSDPANITKISRFDLPGELSDSRLVGDVLYAVTYQNGSCWDCSSTPSTHVASIDVSSVNAPVKVDELSFDDDGERWGWGKRSISVTTERIYIAGPEYGRQQPESSTIQIVDISDPAGDLVAGTSLKVRGEINNRWQMDEFEGVLRVISQPWSWWTDSTPPSLETFDVVSSQELVPLAKLPMVLPERELLRSVRFDGDRGYAVTAVQTDPLFTFDLSDPAHPLQLGELEMPGFLYHMEPRGDRLLALGFDQGNREGAVTVNLFDVSDLAEPTLLRRVNFGGSWAHFPEDQDRIHKAFKIDEESGLILVPFSGWQDTAGWCGRSLSGVQLVDLVNDDLALRGMTTSLGEARRAFVSGGNLFTVAEQEVAAYDISDRDRPALLSGAPLALNVSLTLPTGEQLVRLRQDWYSADLRLEVVPRSSPDALVAAATLNLTDYLRTEHGLGDCGYWYPANEPLFVVGDTVWAIVSGYRVETVSGKGWDHTRSLLIGFSPETGAVTGSLELPFVPGYWGWSDTSRVVRGDAALLVQEGWDEQGQTRQLAALDLSNPAEPRLARALRLPTTSYYASTGLLESGDELITSYAETVAGKDGVVRHFALRIDVTDPLAPELKRAHNVPGYVVDFDAATNVAVTLDHQPIAVTGRSWEECATRLPGSWYDAGRCHGHSATLYRVNLSGGAAKVLDSLRKDELAWATPRRGDARLFFTPGYYRYYSDVASGPGYYYGGWAWASQLVTVVDSGTLASGNVEAPGVWNVVAHGKSLVLAPSAGQPLSVVDATDAAHPTLLEGEETALGYTSHIAISGDDVYLAQGDGGVQHMTLP